MSAFNAEQLPHARVLKAVAPASSPSIPNEPDVPNEEYTPGFRATIIPQGDFTYFKGQEFFGVTVELVQYHTPGRDVVNTVRVTRGEETVFEEDPKTRYEEVKAGYQLERDLEARYGCKGRTLQYAYITRNGNTPIDELGKPIKITPVDGVDMEAVKKIQAESRSDLELLDIVQEARERSGVLYWVDQVMNPSIGNSF